MLILPFVAVDLVEASSHNIAIGAPGTLGSSNQESKARKFPRELFRPCSNLVSRHLRAGSNLSSPESKHDKQSKHTELVMPRLDGRSSRVQQSHLDQRDDASLGPT